MDFCKNAFLFTLLLLSFCQLYSQEYLFDAKLLTTEDGLTSLMTSSVHKDKNGYLWIGTNGGLNRYDGYSFSLCTQEENNLYNEFNLTAHDQAKDGTLYFGGLGRMISFHPKSFEDKLTNNYPLKFVRYQVLEEGAEKETDKTKELIATTNIRVEPTDKFLEVQFVLLDFDDPSQHSYAYQIEGYSNQWTFIEENYVRITSLPYGDYRLRIKGRNIGKGWSEQELFLDIKVAKPFYLQIWFIGVGILSLLGFIVGGVKWRFRSLEKDKNRLENEVKKRTATIQQQAQKLQALNKAKTRFFSNITHEFRTTLTLVIGHLEQVMETELSEENRKELTSVLKNVRHLLGLINQLLDLSKLESGQMKIEVTYSDINAYTKELVNSIKPFSPQELSLRIQKLIRNNVNTIMVNQLKPTSNTIKLSYQKENHFVKEIRTITEAYLNTAGLNGAFIGQQMGMSRMQIHRKLKALMNQSASEFIRETRLQKAYELLQTQNYNSSEVAYQTGFNTLAYFSKTFKEKYGYSPSDLLKKESA